MGMALGIMATCRVDRLFSKRTWYTRAGLLSWSEYGYPDVSHIQCVSIILGLIIAIFGESHGLLENHMKLARKEHDLQLPIQRLDSPEMVEYLSVGTRLCGLLCPRASFCEWQRWKRFPGTSPWCLWPRRRGFGHESSWCHVDKRKGRLNDVRA